jgi:hypothetical protein
MGLGVEAVEILCKWGNYPFRTSVFPFVQSNVLVSARLATTETQLLVCWRSARIDAKPSGKTLPHGEF